MCDRAVVDLVVREAPAQIKRPHQLGHAFRSGKRHLALTREGDIAIARIVHALGDSTGHEGDALPSSIAYAALRISLSGQDVHARSLTHEGACAGSHGGTSTAEKLLIWAKQTILASGGGNGLPRYHESPGRTGTAWPGLPAGAELRTWSSCSFTPRSSMFSGSAAT